MLIEILGWTGSLLVLIAYALVMNKKMLPDSAAYYGLNIAGSCFLIVHTAVHHAFPSMMVNIVWVLIPVITIVKNKSKK